MSSDGAVPRIRTRIWREDPEPGNAFAARKAYCRGYDVHGDMLGRARWVDMLFLLMRGERPVPAEAALLEALSVALANPGPRDPAVHAAMCAGVGGSTSASCLMAALAVGAGRNGGARDVFDAMTLWQDCGTSLDRWREALAAPPSGANGVWPAAEHPAGFDPHGIQRAGVVGETLRRLAGIASDGPLAWLLEHAPELERVTGRPLGIAGVAAAALFALHFDAEEGEMLYLLLRLPGAAAHALEQRRQGHKQFPFFSLELKDPHAEAVE